MMVKEIQRGIPKGAGWMVRNHLRLEEYEQIGEKKLVSSSKVMWTMKGSIKHAKGVVQ